MKPDAVEFRSVLFHGFGDRSRLAIVSALEDGPRRVSEIVASTGLSQPNTSKHLACLWECGLVDRERQGREVYYRLIPGVAELLHAADTVLATTADRVRSCPRYGAGLAECSRALASP
jgi:DNA-binding transcriptional ArsR family regulator